MTKEQYHKEPITDQNMASKKIRMLENQLYKTYLMLTVSLLVNVLLLTLWWFWLRSVVQ